MRFHGSKRSSWPGFQRELRMGRKSRLFMHSLSSLDSRFATQEVEIAKSPALSANLPVRGLSAETSSITTAARVRVGRNPCWGRSKSNDSHYITSRFTNQLRFGVQCTVRFPPQWIDITKLERALLSSCGPHAAGTYQVIFEFPVGCKIMVDAATRLLSLRRYDRDALSEVSLCATPS